MKTILIFVLTFGLGFSARAQESQYEISQNIHYYNDSINQSDSYINERCVLDVYFPKNSKDCATIVWFHGGGLTGGNKEIPDYLKEKGICIVAVNYRLYPKVKAPAYIEDAAAAVSWCSKTSISMVATRALFFYQGIRQVDIWQVWSDWINLGCENTISTLIKLQA